MRAFRSGMVLVAGAGLVAGLSACANPASSGTGVPTADVSTAVEVIKNEDVAAMVPEDLRSAGEFTVAINPDIAPVKFLDSNGQVTGLNPELLQAAGVVMDLDVEFEEATFDALVPGLEAERFDVIASIGDFKERQETVDFIDYLMTGSALIVASDHEGDSLAEADMCGLKLSFVRGTYQQGQIEALSETCTDNGSEGIEAIGYGDANAALLSVKSGQADGFWGDLQQLSYNEKTNPDVYKVVAHDVAGPYGIGINKNDTDFRDALQSALLHLVDIGAYDQALEKWGQQEFGMPEMPLNTGGSIEG